MEMRPNPEVQRAMLREPSMWSKNDREKVAQYMDALDTTDAAFTPRQKALRERKRIDEQKDPQAHLEATGRANAADDAWEQSKATTAALRRDLGPLADVMVEMNVATKKGREALRETLRSIEQPKETRGPEPAREVAVEPAKPQTQEQPKILIEELTAPLEVLRPPEVQPTRKAQLFDIIAENKLKASAPQAEGVITRMAKSRFAKGLYALGTLIGLSGKAAGAIEDFRNEEQKREQAEEVMREMAEKSSFGMAKQYGAIHLELPSPQDVITLENGTTVQRSEKIDAVNAEYTKLIKVGKGFMLDQCGTDLADGTRGLDALKCNAIYGDQVSLRDAGVEALATIHGYTAEELAVHGKIIRDSVMQRPSTIVFDNKSVVGMTYYDYAALPGSFKADSDDIYHRYYDDASDMAFNAIRSLDIGPEDKDAIKAVQSAIKAEIELANVTLIVTSEMLAINNDLMATALMTGTYDAQTNTQYKATIDDLHNARDAADLAWRTVAANEGQAGPMHEFQRTMEDVHLTKTDTLLRAGRDAGTHRDFFMSQLEKIDPAT